MVSSVSSLIVRLVCAGRTGALFTSVATTVKLFVALKGGDPLSVTLVVKTFVLGPWASVGVQVMIPSEEIVAFVGAVRSAYVRRLPASGSVAVLVTVRLVSSVIERLVCAGRTGA